MPLGPFSPNFGFGLAPNGATQFTIAISGAAAGYAAPANATAFLVQADSTNLTNIRYRPGSAAANASLGHQLEPGRSEYVSFGSTLSLCVEGGTCLVQVTWYTLT